MGKLSCSLLRQLNFFSAILDDVNYLLGARYAGACL